MKWLEGNYVTIFVIIFIDIAHESFVSAKRTADGRRLSFDGGGGAPSRPSIVLKQTNRGATVEQGATSKHWSEPASVEYPPDEARILDAPFIIKHGQRVTVEYRCYVKRVIVLQVNIYTDLQSDVRVFRKVWQCPVHTNTKLRRQILITFPPKVAYAPSSSNKHSVIVKTGMLSVWMVDPSIWSHLKTRPLGGITSYTTALRNYLVHFLPPYGRPQRPARVCQTWFEEFKEEPFNGQCVPEKGLVFEGLGYPIVLTGGSMGVHRVIPPFSNKLLEKARQDSITSPRFTVEVWLYIEEYCPYSSLDRCSIMKHMSWNDLFMTPSIYVNRRGQIRITIITEKTNPYRVFTDFSIPRREWVRVVLQFQSNQWTVTANYGKKWKMSHSYSYQLPLQLGDRSYYNDTDCLHIFGGSEMVRSFKGILGKVNIYRHRKVDIQQLEFPPDDHPMFTVFTPEHYNECKIYHNFHAYEIRWYVRKMQRIFNRLKQVTSLDEVFYTFYPHSIEMMNEQLCYPFEAPKPKGHARIKKLLNNLKITSIESSILGKEIYQAAMNLISKDGVYTMSTALSMLQAASCYKNHDATFMMATVYDHGLAVHTDKVKALKLLLRGAQDGHRGCLMAMGNKHVLGLDGLPADIEQGYAYYQQVAQRTRDDFENESEREVHPDHIRLTDTQAVDDHTDIDGDLYLWYKFQADQGELFAQKEMARLLYWGTKGIVRDLRAAARYYRLAAEHMDPSSLYDYGLILLKGQGVVKDVGEGVRILRMAAEHGWTPAMNTLGWHAMNIERNYTRAFAYFLRAAKLNNPDAAHNLGHMYLYGLAPEVGTDKWKVYGYFEKAALLGHIDSGFWVAMYQMRGHPTSGRNVDGALSWARFVAERNPYVTHLLGQGLRAYKESRWDLSLFYYTLAAQTGSEVGNFNLAYLCEQNYEDVASLLSHECVYTHFNYTTQRQSHQVTAYSWIKMGDYYWMHNDSHVNFDMAATMYGNAAKTGDPQALFNLALMAEEQPKNEALKAVWRKLGIPLHIWYRNDRLIMDLYSRCQESDDHEAYLACTLAMYKVWFFLALEQHALLIKAFGFSTMFGVIIGGVLALLFYLSQHVNRNIR